MTDHAIRPFIYQQLVHKVFISQGQLLTKNTFKCYWTVFKKNQTLGLPSTKLSDETGFFSQLYNYSLKGHIINDTQLNSLNKLCFLNEKVVHMELRNKEMLQRKLTLFLFTIDLKTEFQTSNNADKSLQPFSKIFGLGNEVSCGRTCAFALCTIAYLFFF